MDEKKATSKEADPVQVVKAELDTIVNKLLDARSHFSTQEYDKADQILRNEIDHLSTLIREFFVDQSAK